MLIKLSLRANYFISRFSSHSRSLPRPPAFRLAAQTNTQLLHVLCDLVQAFIDTEKQIEVSLTKLGFGDENISGSQADSEVLSSLDDMIMDKHTGMNHSHQHQGGGNQRGTPVNNNNAGDAANTDFCDDGPDLINPSSFLLTPDSLPRDLLNPNSGLKIDDDVVLGYSKRLRTAVDRILHLLKNVASLQYDPVALTSSGISRDQQSCSRVISKSASMPTCSASACDHRQEIMLLQSDLREATRMNQVLQEEVNKKHNALSALRAQIETQSILDAKSLKQANEDLVGKLAVAERKIHRQAEMINQLRSDSTRIRDDCAVIEVTPERGRRDRPYSPPDLHLNDTDSLPFDKSDELLNLDELESLSPDKWDHHYDEVMQAHDKEITKLLTTQTAEAGDGLHRSYRPADYQRQQERESLLQILQEKDEEIEVLKNQMKLAQNMIANAFPDHKIEEYLDVDLIETLVDTHLKHRINRKDGSEVTGSAKKNRFSGVDLIEPIQDMRGSNGQDSPKSSTSGGHLTSNETSFLEVQVMDAKISQLQSVMEKLIAKNSQVQFELEDYKSQNGLLARDIDLLRKQKESRDQMILEQERELIGLKLSLEGKEEEITRMKREQDNVKEQEVDILQRKVRMLTEEISSKEDRIQNLTRRIDVMRMEANTRKEFEKREEAEVSAQMTQLNAYNRDLQRQVKSSQLKVQSLLTKIESLKLEIESKALDGQRVKEMEAQLKTSKDMIEDKKNKIKELMDTMRKLALPPPDVPTPRTILKRRSVTAEEACDIYQMAAKLKKCQHQKRELIYQKNYLLKLLSGFHLTEAATLAFIAHMKEGVGPDLEDEAPKLKPISKFRAAVNAVIAIHRMRCLVNKWALSPFVSQKKVHVTTPEEMAFKPPFTKKNNGFTASATATFNRSKSRSQEPSIWDRVDAKEKTVEKSRAVTDATVDDFWQRIRSLHDNMNFSHTLSEPDSLF